MRDSFITMICFAISFATLQSENSRVYSQDAKPQAVTEVENGNPEVAGVLPDGATKFPELTPSSGNAYRTENAVFIVLDEIPADQKLTIPRMANVVDRVRWIGSDPTSTMTLKSEIDHWIINLSGAAPVSDKKILQLQVDAPPLAFNGIIIASADGDGVISLPAKFATTHGSKLRFEPQPHKNTVGYWAVEEDTAEWHLKIDTLATYDVEILQGCGKGHGGSDVELRIADQKLEFKVEDTGHFQNFRWRHLGQVTLSPGDDVSLKLVATKKAAGAVMDCREIRLVPAKKT